MTEGISKETVIRLMQDPNCDSSDYAIYDYLLTFCTELDPWLPIKDAHKDKDILVYAPAYQDLRPLKQVCRWHESAGFCIDELRAPTHYKLLPDDPK